MTSSSRFAGKVVVITGASSGIGLATAQRFLDEGATVVAVSNRHTELTAAVAELRHTGRVEPIVADIGRSEEIKLITEGAAAAGGTDILVNNAGICDASDFDQISEEQWERTLRINLTGPFITSKALLAQLAAKPGAAIVNTASANGLAAEARLAHYNASKGGLVMLTRSMALDLADLGIRVNAVAPGIIHTPLNDEWFATHSTEVLRRSVPLGRRGHPAEVAACIAFLASDDASYVTGEILVCDGGQLADNEAK